MLNVGDCVMIVGDLSKIEKGSFGKVLELYDSMAIVMCGKYKIRVNYKNIVKVLHRKIRIGDLKRGDLFCVKSNDNVAVMEKRTDDLSYGRAVVVGDPSRFYMFHLDYSVSQIEYIESPVKKGVPKHDVVFLEKRFSTILKDGKPWGVVCYITLSDDGMKTTVEKMGAAYTNFDAGDVFDYETGCNLAFKRAVEQEKVKTRKIIFTNNGIFDFNVKMTA